MKVRIEKVLNLAASGAWRATAALIVDGNGKPTGVALLMQGEGQTVNVVLSGDEAVAFGSMAHVCGCIVEGGMPPALPEEPPPSPVLINGGRQ